MRDGPIKIGSLVKMLNIDGTYVNNHLYYVHDMKKGKFKIQNLDTCKDLPGFYEHHQLKFEDNLLDDTIQEKQKDIVTKTDEGIIHFGNTKFERITK